jgi:ribosome-binding factor A
MARLRIEKMQNLIKQELSKIILNDIKDPRVKLVTVTEVNLTDDLSYAKVFVSFYGSEKEQDEAWTALNKALGFMRSEVAKKIRFRVAPKLVLKKDTSLEYSSHIQEILQKINKEDEEK